MYYYEVQNVWCKFKIFSVAGSDIMLVEPIKDNVVFDQLYTLNLTMCPHYNYSKVPITEESSTEESTIHNHVTKKQSKWKKLKKAAEKACNFLFRECVPLSTNRYTGEPSPYVVVAMYPFGDFGYR